MIYDKGDVMKVKGSREFSENKRQEFIESLEIIKGNNYDCQRKVKCSKCIFSSAWASDIKSCCSNSMFNFDMDILRNERIDEVLDELKSLQNI